MPTFWQRTPTSDANFPVGTSIPKRYLSSNFSAPEVYLVGITSIVMFSLLQNFLSAAMASCLSSSIAIIARSALQIWSKTSIPLITLVGYASINAASQVIPGSHSVAFTIKV